MYKLYMDDDDDEATIQPNTDWLEDGGIQLFHKYKSTYWFISLDMKTKVAQNVPRIIHVIQRDKQ